MMSRGVHKRNPAVPPPPSGADRTPLGLSDDCPHCGGPLLIIPGHPQTFKARCQWCEDLWVQADDLSWRRDRLPVGIKLALISLPILLWIAGHVDVMP
jgi:hypothetical protein